jgi:hypothetical protein
VSIHGLNHHALERLEIAGRAEHFHPADGPVEHVIHQSTGSDPRRSSHAPHPNSQPNGRLYEDQKAKPLSKLELGRNWALWDRGRGDGLARHFPF